MKGELVIILGSIILVIGLGYAINNIQGDGIGLTGFAVLNSTFDDNGSGNNYEINNRSTVATEEQVLEAIDESYRIMAEMTKNNFSIVYMNDTLLEAKRVLEQVYFAEILRNEVNATKEEKKEASQALQLVDLESLTYSDVIVYTDEIKNRKKQAFILFDSISAVKITIEEYYDGDIKKIDSKESIKLLIDAENAFLEDRYDDAENLLIQSREELELEKSESTTLNTVRKNTKNFIQRNWIYILLVLVALGTMGYYLNKKIEKSLLRKKIKKMRTESKVLLDLMKKAQIERYKENKISALVYNTRIEKYKERLQEIKEKLPVFKSRLNKLKKIKK
jgi:hypothetical protein